MGERTITSDFLTKDPATQRVLAVLDRVAPSPVPVLILGESGTGKELLARRLHKNSARANGPLICVNCAALQETLLLSELFGHERGAFTGATESRQGLVEAAHRGTLFLDEIGEMGPEAQAKLLRVLQDGELYRVGGRASIRVDVRVVAATNRDLEARIRTGAFREDLLYRINTVVLRVAPLRMRPDDVPYLLRTYLDRPNALRKIPLRVQPEAMAKLRAWKWPGNVRELANLCERLSVLVDADEISIDDLPTAIAGLTEIDDASSLRLDDVERRHILRVLALFEGNKTRAGAALDVTVKTLYNKLARYQREKLAGTEGLLLTEEPSEETPSTTLQ